MWLQVFLKNNIILMRRLQMTQKNRGLKYRVPFSNVIEKNYMIHLKVIQKKLKYQCPKC